VLSDADLHSAEGKWPLTVGWFEKAKSLKPDSAVAFVGGQGMITLPGGAIFKEVSFKTIHEIVEVSLPLWANAVGRRWAKVEGDSFIVSDGKSWMRSELRIEQ